MKQHKNIQNFKFPSEFKTDGDIYKLFNDNNLMVGRMISGSKSRYHSEHPDNIIVFNANIIIKSKGKIWHGDLSFPPDTDNVQNICDKLKESLYVLYEMDARFGTENDSIEELIQKSVITFNPQ